jgi:hypothetical protein
MIQEERIDITDYTPQQLVKLLDYPARVDLRQAYNRGYINRVHLKERGVRLLEVLGLVKKVKRYKTMYRYEPTALGERVYIFLPSEASEHNRIYFKTPLVYLDGTVIKPEEEPRYYPLSTYNKFYRRTEDNE